MSESAENPYLQTPAQPNNLESYGQWHIQNMNRLYRELLEKPKVGEKK